MHNLSNAIVWIDSFKDTAKPYKKLAFLRSGNIRIGSTTRQQCTWKLISEKARYPHPLRMTRDSPVENAPLLFPNTTLAILVDEI